MLEIRNISKKFGQKTLLEKVSLQLGPGEIVFLLGRSGVGKSVLLKLIVGLLAQDSGQVIVDGEETHPQDEESMTEIRKKCGLVFQLPALLDSLTVRENLFFGMENLGSVDLEAQMQAIELEKSVLGKYPRELSFGTQKKVSLLRTTLRRPKYLLFDEPTTGLDPVSVRATNQTILTLAKKLGAGCLIVSHDVRSAIEIAERVILLDNGKLVFEGTPEKMKTTKLSLASEFMKDTVFFD